MVEGGNDNNTMGLRRINERRNLDKILQESLQVEWNEKKMPLLDWVHLWLHQFDINHAETFTLADALQLCFEHLRKLMETQRSDADR